MSTDVVILGSTGSIGTQALEVIDENPGRFNVVALAAGGANRELLANQAARYGARVVAIADGEGAGELRERLKKLGSPAEVIAGPGAIAQVAGMLTDPASAGRGQVVLNGVTGSVGLEPTLAALASGATLALANKESLVAGGALVARAMVRPGQIVPVDSEHSAMAQALGGGRHEKGLTSGVVTGVSEVRRLILTASGGPFRGWSRRRMRDVTPQQALAHPTWNMGPVVTINSSTLMNKGLELIEAHLLFDVPAADITPVVHPQSIVHSMVEFTDGSTLAQASPPNMKLPIALGLTWPQRLVNVQEPCRWDSAVSWDFEPVDEAVFPALRLAREAAGGAQTLPAVLNAANEEGVDAFIRGALDYLGIVEINEAVMNEHDPGGEPGCAEDIREVENWARERARALVAAR